MPDTGRTDPHYPMSTTLDTVGPWGQRAKGDRHGADGEAFAHLPRRPATHSLPIFSPEDEARAVRERNEANARLTANRLETAARFGGHEAPPLARRRIGAGHLVWVVVLPVGALVIAGLLGLG